MTLHPRPPVSKGGKMIESVIFDMDGVIFDSERIVCDLWIDFAKENGMSGMDELIIKCIGINDNATKKLFLEAYGEGCPYDEYKKVISQKYHELYDGGRLPMKPGVKELLGFLKENDIKTALASSTKVKTVTNQLTDAGILEYFDVVIGGDMVTKSKPDPEIFLEAADKLGVDPTKSFIIEDSLNGIKAAYAAGAKPLMVPDLIKPDEEIQKICYNIFVNLHEIKAFFANFLH